ncbi:hypothetical protein [Parabacteroides distasonis]|uniref:Transmembrane protein n=1 Tax=Parabacteroides distasonis TaxID=823 RepID=A0A4S2EXB9_PARDI|nr:hypothetical protein [Parabacteroides distasonis]TGY59354.1 hypothetical protein E5342_06510 [Parabacteroides distasonis]
MEDRILTERESLELITRMIKETQENTARYAAYPLLIWGYITLAIALVIWYVLSFVGDYYQIQFLWFLLPVVAFPLTLYYSRKDSAHRGTRNYIDRIIGQIWMVFGMVGFFLSVASWVGKVDIYFLIPLLMGMGVTLSGSVSRFKPMAVLGMVGVISSFLILWIHGIDRLLVFSVIFVAMMVIPGHLLNYQMKKQCLKN